MYEFFLTLHSWLRWVVLVGGASALVLAVQGLATRSEYAKSHRTAGIVFLASTHTMLLLGLVLMVVSPIVGAAWSDMGAAMKAKTLRFWAVEHTTLMLLAVVSVTVGHVAAKRAVESSRKHRRALIGFGLGFALILLGIPWPLREEIGRALFRF